MDKGNKTIIAVVITVVVLALVAAYGVWHSSTRSVASYQSAADEAMTLFEQGDRTEKVKAYHRLQDLSASIDRASYFMQSREEMSILKEEIENYSQKIADSFADEYAGTFSRNNYRNLDAIDDRDKITQAIVNLKDLQSLIKADNILGKAEINNYDNLVNEKIKVYQTFLAETDSEEESESESEVETSEEITSEEQATSQAETTSERPNESQAPNINGGNKPPANRPEETTTVWRPWDPSESSSEENSESESSSEIESNDDDSSEAQSSQNGNNDSSENVTEERPEA